MRLQNFSAILHGCDYNPEQWLNSPNILQQDISYMKEAHITCVSLGIFSWAFLEPEENLYDFEWLGTIVDRLYAAGISTFLATPTAAKPRWLAEKYEETRRMDATGVRIPVGGRHNHCYTSPIYRRKSRVIITKLADFFQGHPGVVLWHVNNEVQGECFCPLCQEAFRGWLRERYATLDALNNAWCTAFWSNTYSDWSQIHAPQNADAPHGLQMDWKRFVTHQTADFLNMEIRAIRDGGSILPTTVNLMEHYMGLNYNRLGELIDIVSWDSYPDWHGNPHADNELDAALSTALMHDYMRTMKGRPFLLMESTPSTVNWREVSPLKRPGILNLGAMQAIAHGAASVQYFQWRQSRNNNEKNHGAVIAHDSRKDTRVFREVTSTGKRLATLSAPEETYFSKAAVLFDRENGWAMDLDRNPMFREYRYPELVMKYYRPLWQSGVRVDVPDMEQDLSSYSLVICPSLYLLRADIADRLRNFVENGGTLIATFHFGMVDVSAGCFLGKLPHNLDDVFGIIHQETDYLPEGRYNSFTWHDRQYRVSQICELLTLSEATAEAVYETDFYKNSPVLTKHSYGKGTAWYLAADPEASFLDAFYSKLLRECHIPAYSCEKGVIITPMPERNLLCIQNYNASKVQQPLPGTWHNAENSSIYRDMVPLPPYSAVLVHPETINP